MDDMAAMVFDEVVASLCFEVALDVHKGCKLGKLCLKCPSIGTSSTPCNRSLNHSVRRAIKGPQ